MASAAMTPASPRVIAPSGDSSLLRPLLDDAVKLATDMVRVATGTELEGNWNGVGGKRILTIFRGSHRDYREGESGA